MGFPGVISLDILGNSYFMTHFNVKQDETYLQQAMNAYNQAVFLEGKTFGETFL